jgi:SagB-type dehydrogenase family enzyme
MYRIAAALALLVVVTVACGEGERGGSSASETREPRVGPTAVTSIVLPPPRTRSDVSVEEALAERRSVRAFTPGELTLAEIGQLLWAAQGITADWGGRTAPSAGALYPLEVYVVVAGGAYRYEPDGHRAEVLSGDDLRLPLQTAALAQSAVGDAPAVIVIAAVYARTAVKYGDRATRYVQLEAGHAAQNVLLQAVALGLAAVPIGAFDDAGVQRVLGLPSDQRPLYLIPVGHPGEEDAG